MQGKKLHNRIFMSINQILIDKVCFIGILLTFLKTLLSRMHEHSRKCATPVVKRPDAFADASYCFGDFSRSGKGTQKRNDGEDENGSMQRKGCFAVGIGYE